RSSRLARAGFPADAMVEVVGLNAGRRGSLVYRCLRAEFAAEQHEDAQQESNQILRTRKNVRPNMPAVNHLNGMIGPKEKIHEDKGSAHRTLREGIGPDGGRHKNDQQTDVPEADLTLPSGRISPV